MIMAATDSRTCSDESCSLKSNEETASITSPKRLSINGLKRNIQRLKNIPAFRDRFVYSVCVTWLVFVQGWIKGQIGPAIPDILHITSTELERGSAYLTSFYVGKVLGSMTGGFIYDKCNKNWYISIIYLLHGVAIATIPWCVHFEIMVGVFCCTGLLSSWMDVAGITCTMAVYGEKGNVYVQTNQLMMSVASVLSPLVSAPYLLPPETEHLNNDKNKSIVLNRDPVGEHFNNYSFTLTNELKGNYTPSASTSEFNRKSQLFIPLTITTCLIITSSLTFFALQMCGKRKILLSTKDHTLPTSDKTSFGLSYYICVLNICLLGAYISALEVSMGNLLSVFCIKHLGWSPAEGAFAISVFFCAYTVSRVISIIASKYLQPTRLMIIYTIISIVFFSAFLLSAYLYSSMWTWVCVGLCGFALSGLYPALLVCLNQIFQYVSGKFVSLLLVTSYVGSLSNPPLVTFLMTEFDTLWFAYLNVIICILSLISLIFLVCFKKSRTLRSSTVVEC